tara:strand:- start:196 stop:360 length:165 start_codon:yes stop_codon:yes gene_type:complete
MLMDKKKKKKNPILDPVKKLLLRKDNIAPAAKFIQRKKKQNDLIKSFLDGTHGL